MMANDSAPLDVPLGSSGRPLNVLHIGNIANNAYYNAKFQRRNGIEADVLCHDDYWIMSSPEWEEADLEGTPSDQIRPDWTTLDLKGYQRPKWFAQGPFITCVDYLLAKQEQRSDDAGILWNQLAAACKLRPAGAAESMASLKDAMIARAPSRFRRFGNKWLARIRCRVRDECSSPVSFHNHFIERCQFLIDDFARRFPDRRDRLTLDDLLPYEFIVQRLQPLFAYYDVVHAYATDPLYPMLAGYRPYVAFEHGTLRDAPEWKWAYKGPFYDSPLGRLTALSYARADYVFITNADCLDSAKRLAINNYEPIPHPLDEVSFAPVDEQRDKIRRLVEKPLFFFCPIRHDWIDKGTDIYIRALPALRRALGDHFVVCFTPWGQEIEKSKALIRELGCEDCVRWVGPFARVPFVRWLSAADVVFDQLKYASFSGLTPRVMACGVPVIAAYEPSAMSWMFPEPAPVLPARTREDVVRQVQTALASGFRVQYQANARAWIMRYHSSSVVTRQLLRTYQSLTEKCCKQQGGT